MNGGVCFAEDMHLEQVDHGTLGYEETGHLLSTVQGRKFAAPDQGSTTTPWPDLIRVDQPNGNMAEQQERARRIQGLITDAEMQQHNSRISQFISKMKGAVKIDTVPIFNGVDIQLMLHLICRLFLQVFQAIKPHCCRNKHKVMGIQGALSQPHPLFPQLL